MSIKNKKNLKKYGIGGDILDWIVGIVPTKVKNFLKKHGEEITSLSIGRTPIEKYINVALNAITNNKFNELMKQSGYDKFFHLFLIINGKYRLEKNQNLTIYDYKKADKEENQDININKKLTINDLINNAAGNSKESQKNLFSNYDPFKNNCQDTLLKILSSSGLLTSGADKFIKQDTSKLISGLSSTVQTGAKTTTDIASGLDKAIQFISGGRFSFSTGGIIRRHFIKRVNGRRRLIHF